MKKIHLMLLIVSAITAITSAYSLAAINQVYRIGFQWYSEYQNKFVDETREISRDRWLLGNYPESKNILVISDAETLNSVYDDYISKFDLKNFDFDRNILIYCKLGKFNSPEYRIRVSDVAQRGDVVEVIINITSPPKEVKRPDEHNTYTAADLIKIDRNSFPIKGTLLFIFKDTEGTQLGEQYSVVR